mmetsp:Transcript_23560/g.67467  ORF Transcript_23560/g.67467 Transcript_23560/m.67467 type:complete len:127 (-) Transcript_23560:18-398(-)
MANGSAEQQAQQQRLNTAFERLKDLVRTEPCVIFSTTVCPFCDRAADFFKKIERPCRKIELDTPVDEQTQMMGMALAMATRQRTVPNIFIKGKHVGGFDRLLAAYEQCKAGQMPGEHADVCGMLME